MPTIERFDSEGRETLPEHRAAMNAPMRPARAAMDDVEADEYQALVGLIQGWLHVGGCLIGDLYGPSHDQAPPSPGQPSGC